LSRSVQDNVTVAKQGCGAGGTGDPVRMRCRD
jgi:hypothetical protein